MFEPGVIKKISIVKRVSNFETRRGLIFPFLFSFELRNFSSLPSLVVVNSYNNRSKAEMGNILNDSHVAL